MSDSENSRFKFSFDQDRPEVEDIDIAEEVDDLRIDKLKRRISLISILIPLLFGAVIVLGYLDIKNRFDKNISSGSAEIQSLSKALESRFSSLSIRQAKLEAMLTEKFNELEKASVALKIRIRKTETRLNSDMSTRKDDEAAIENRIAGIDASLAPITAEIEKIKASTRTLNHQLKTGMARLADDIKQSRTDLVKLTSAKLDKKMFELALRHEEKMMQQKWETLNKSVALQLAQINEKLSAIEASQKQPASGKSVPAKTSSAEPPATPEKTARPTVSKPGAITEKEIK